MIDEYNDSFDYIHSLKEGLKILENVKFESEALKEYEDKGIRTIEPLPSEIIRRKNKEIENIKNKINQNFEIFKNMDIKVSGVSHDNDDGSSRQEIIKRSKVGDELEFIHSPVKQDENAVKIIKKNGEQLGWVSKYLSTDLSQWIQSGKLIEGYIKEILEPDFYSGNNYYGCRIIIAVYNRPHYTNNQNKDIPNVINIFRKNNLGKSTKKLVDNYYWLLNKIEESKKNKNFSKMLEFCQASLSLIEPLIIEIKNMYGSFDIKSIPAIEIGCNFWAILGQKGQLMNIKEVIDFYPELEPWKETIEYSFKKQKLAAKIYKYVRANEGVKQKDLKNLMKFNDGNLIGNVCYYMDLLGKLRRIKLGNSYILSVL